MAGCETPAPFGVGPGAAVTNTIGRDKYEATSPNAMRSFAVVSVLPPVRNCEGPACGQSVSESTHGLVMGTLQSARAERVAAAPMAMATTSVESLTPHNLLANPVT